MSQLFISYRRDDSASITGRLIDRLRNKYPYLDIFHDVKSIPAGTDFNTYTQERVSAQDIFLIIIGKEWMRYITERNKGEDFVRNEVELALEKGCKILPIYVNGATPPSAKKLPNSIVPLAYINGLKLRSDPDFDNDLARVTSFLDKEIASRTSPVKKLLRKVKTLDYKLLSALAGGIILLIFLYNLFGMGEKKCPQEKIATIVANFSDDKTDGFANTLVLKLDHSLPDSLFNVRGSEYQDRNIDNYNNYIKKSYFNETCNTSGLYVNGFRDEGQKLFNLYANNVGLKLKTPEYLTENSIVLTELEEAKFSVEEDAQLIHDFIKLWLSYYLDDSKAFIKNSYQIQKDHNLSIKNEKLKGKLSTSILGPIFLMRADHYAIEGNEKMAKKHYKKVLEFDNPNVTKIASLNLSTAQPIADLMYKDTELRKVRADNVMRHGQIESEFRKFLRELGEVLKTLFEHLNIK